MQSQVNEGVTILAFCVKHPPLKKSGYAPVALIIGLGIRCFDNARIDKNLFFTLLSAGFILKQSILALKN